MMWPKRRNLLSVMVRERVEAGFTPGRSTVDRPNCPKATASSSRDVSDFNTGHMAGIPVVRYADDLPNGPRVKRINAIAKVGLYFVVDHVSHPYSKAGTTYV